MKTILESIQEKDYTSAQDQLHERLQDIVVEKLHEMKKMIAAKMTEQSLSNPTTLRSVEYAKRGLAEENPKDKKEVKKPLFGKYQKGPRKQPNDWVKKIYTGKMKEEKGQ